MDCIFLESELLPQAQVSQSSVLAPVLATVMALVILTIAGLLWWVMKRRKKAEDMDSLVMDTVRFDGTGAGIGNTPTAETNETVPSRNCDSGYVNVQFENNLYK